jgi:hypothetical protein
MQKENEHTLIQIVLVLYKTKLEDSFSYKTLCEHGSALTCDYELLIYNNSPEIFVEQSDSYTVVNAEKNEKLAGAYNYALQQAIKQNRRWLLLLDQDTRLTKEYVEQLNKVLHHDNVAVIVPKLCSKQTHLSPFSYHRRLGPWTKTWGVFETGLVKNQNFVAFNSAALFSVDALKKTGGFGTDFPLDQLDMYIFYRLCKNKESFYLMNVVLQHELSILDYKNRMSGQRYLSFIDAEYRFSKVLGILAGLTLKMRLALRGTKQLFVKEKRQYALITFKYLFKI